VSLQRASQVGSPAALLAKPSRSMAARQPAGYTETLRWPQSRSEYAHVRLTWRASRLSGQLYFHARLHVFARRCLCGGSKGNPGSPRDGAGSPPDEAPITDPRAKMAYWWFPVVFIVNCGSPRCKAHFRRSNCRPADRFHPPGEPVGRARAPAVAGRRLGAFAQRGRAHCAY
jgi:hypothetical protein